MFYLFSKLLAFLIRPSVWVLALLILGFWTYPKRGLRYFKWALVVFCLFGNTAILHTVVKWWEPEPVKLEHRYHVGVVLGGYMSDNRLASFLQPEYGERMERPLHAIALFNEGRVDSLLFTGGSGGVLHKQRAEADVLKDHLTALGLENSKFIYENEAVNTHENATKTALLINKADTLVLISSAWHLPRAAACFRQQGMKVLPYPVDFMQEMSPLYPTDYLLPKPYALWHWELLIKEWVGYVVYDMKGYL